MADVARMPTRPRHSTQSPDDDREIAGIVARLLLHYFTPADLSESARQAMARDWLDDLREFGPQIVADACAEWRHKPGGHRPTPGDIRVLCVERQRIRREHAALSAPDSMDDYARSVGWRNNAERVEAIRRDEADREARYERARLARQGMTR